MENNNEMIDKLKESVIAKLDELDSNKNYDSTLIDYILVMVVNQKSKYEMKDNLALFLGQIVDKFVNWLFGYLSEINLSKKETIKVETKSEDTTEDETAEKKSSPTVNDENKNVNSKTESKKVGKKLRSAIIIADESKFLKSESQQPPQRKRNNNNDDYSLHKTKRICSHGKVIAKKSNISNKRSNVESNNNTNAQESDTQFLVTLDGVNQRMLEGDNLDKDVFDVMGNEVFDEELMNEDLSQSLAQRSKKESSREMSNKVERCKYWPSCMNGSNCEYVHPSIECKNFPYCRFGDKCLYIHPQCKFGLICSRSNCPYAHDVVTRRPPVPPIINCKYFPNCMNQYCEYFHPKTCHFGAGCRTPNCPFVHPPTTIPHPSQLKWSSKTTPVTDLILAAPVKEEIPIK